MNILGELSSNPFFLGCSWGDVAVDDELLGDSWDSSSSSSSYERLDLPSRDAPESDPEAQSVRSGRSGRSNKSGKSTQSKAEKKSKTYETRSKSGRKPSLVSRVLDFGRSRRGDESDDNRSRLSLAPSTSAPPSRRPTSFRPPPSILGAKPITERVT